MAEDVGHVAAESIGPLAVEVGRVDEECVIIAGMARVEDGQIGCKCLEGMDKPDEVRLGLGLLA